MQILNLVKCLAIAGLFFLATTLSNAAPQIYSAEKQDVVVTKDNPEFVIKLQSNPTTGYSWFLRQYDKRLITSVSHVFEPPQNKKLMGAPGAEVWTFRVNDAGFVTPQQTVITLIYARPWEKKPGKELQFRVSTMGK